MPVMIITGASTGVGKAAALRFAQEGYEVCALARSADKLRELEQRTDGAVRAYPADVSDSADVANVFAAVRERHGGLDVLVNNAGVTTGGRTASASLVDEVIDTNLKGTMYCTFEALPMLRENGGGHIFNVASIAGVDIAPNGNDGLYAASKHGMVAFSESIGKMVRRDGVLVTALCPGGIDTPLWGTKNPYPFDKKAMIRPEEVADLMAYILAQPKRTLFKNVIFVPIVEQW